MPFTPAGMGVSEAAAELGASFVGLENGVGMALALLDRAVLICWKIPAGLIAIIVIYNRLANWPQKSTD